MSKIESCQVEVDDDPALDAAMEDDCNLEEEQMSKLMGFSGFDSTKVRQINFETGTYYGASSNCYYIYM